MLVAKHYGKNCLWEAVCCSFWAFDSIRYLFNEIMLLTLVMGKEVLNTPTNNTWYFYVESGKNFEQSNSLLYKTLTIFLSFKQKLPKVVITEQKRRYRSTFNITILSKRSKKKEQNLLLSLKEDERKKNYLNLEHQNDHVFFSCVMIFQFKLCFCFKFLFCFFFFVFFVVFVSIFLRNIVIINTVNDTYKICYSSKNKLIISV